MNVTPSWSFMVTGSVMAGLTLVVAGKYVSPLFTNLTCSILMGYWVPLGLKTFENPSIGGPGYWKSESESIKYSIVHPRWVYWFYLEYGRKYDRDYDVPPPAEP